MPPQLHHVSLPIHVLHTAEKRKTASPTAKKPKKNETSKLYCTDVSLTTRCTPILMRQLLCPLGGGREGERLLLQTLKLSPQNMVTDHGIQEIFGLNRIKRGKHISKSENFLGDTPPDPLHNVYFCSKLLYSLYCKTLPPPQKYFSR